MKGATRSCHTFYVYESPSSYSYILLLDQCVIQVLLLIIVSILYVECSDHEIGKIRGHAIPMQKFVFLTRYQFQIKFSFIGVCQLI